MKKLYYIGKFKQLKKFGFEEFNDDYSRFYANEIRTDINKKTREIRDTDTDYSFFEIKDLGKSKRVQDLIKSNLVEERDND